MCFLKSFLDSPLFLIKESQGSLLFLIRIVQFSRCCFLLSLRELNYYITFSSVCQVLFQNFFSEVFPSYSTASEQPIYYITFFQVCQAFFKISFWKFLSAFLPFKTALILYHFPLGLSSTFSELSSQSSLRFPCLSSSVSNIIIPHYSQFVKDKLFNISSTKVLKSISQQLRHLFLQSFVLKTKARKQSNNHFQAYIQYLI